MTTKTFDEDGITRTTVDAPLEMMPGGRFFLHMEWMSGQDPKSNVDIELEVGAGCGSSLMQVSIKKGQKTHYWHVNMADWLQQFVTARLAEGLPDDGTTDLIVSKVGDVTTFRSVRE